MKKFKTTVNRLFPLLLFISLTQCQTKEQANLSQSEWMIARAKSLELDSEYVPPPGEAINHSG